MRSRTVGVIRSRAGRAEHPNLLARHLSTGPSRSPRMGAADPPRPGRHGRRIAVLFGQLRRLGLKPMQARLRLGQSSAAASADYATGRREPIYLLAGGAEEPKGCVNTEFRRGGSDTACLCSAFDVVCGCGEMPQATLTKRPECQALPQGPNGIEGASFPWALPSFWGKRRREQVAPRRYNLRGGRRWWWIGRTRPSSRTYSRIALYH
jgi:hypothetical protein